MEGAGATAGTGGAWPQFPTPGTVPLLLLRTPSASCTVLYNTWESPKSIHLHPSIPEVLLIEASALVSRLALPRSYRASFRCLLIISNQSNEYSPTRDHNGGIRSPHWHCQRKYWTRYCLEMIRFLTMVTAPKPAVCADQRKIILRY